ncbi:hypothetical protein E4H12_00360 [Candidatus Thorarchaeota archaeon]|nr:hypothetical protein [Candidatus Thorarchaeota archaeon]TFH00062.1 MAG: hypothetical protein E4H12_00360 [Candidatus Thorarchaeota archaeon]
MKKKSTLLFLVGLFILSFSITPHVAGNPSVIESGTEVEWRVSIAPRNITNMYYSEGGNMIAENESLMSCTVSQIADDVSGYYTIGNVSVLANDTEIARDLVLGVWGNPTEWWPGFFVETGSANIAILNATAFASAERVSGNYLNGTMTSRIENYTFAIWNSTTEDYSLMTEECIIFDYEQDLPLFGEPQITHLAYSLITGVLIKANTSYSFGIPYNLVVTLSEIYPLILHDYPVIPQPIALWGLFGGTILAIAVVIYMRSRRNN